MYILIDNYDSFTHIIRHYLNSNKVKVEVLRNDEKRAIDVINKNPSGIIISPGPKTPDDAGICIELIKLASKVSFYTDKMGLDSIVPVCLSNRNIHTSLYDSEAYVAGMLFKIVGMHDSAMFTIMHS